MSSKRDERDDSNAGGGEGTHGGLAIGRTTGMGAGVKKGGTPGAGDAGADIETGGDSSETGGDSEDGSIDRSSTNFEV